MGAWSNTDPGVMTKQPPHRLHTVKEHFYFLSRWNSSLLPERRLFNDDVTALWLISFYMNFSFLLRVDKEVLPRTTINLNMKTFIQAGCTLHDDECMVTKI